MMIPKLHPMVYKIRNGDPIVQGASLVPPIIARNSGKTLVDHVVYASRSNLGYFIIPIKMIAFATDRGRCVSELSQIIGQVLKVNQISRKLSKNQQSSLFV